MSNNESAGFAKKALTLHHATCSRLGFAPGPASSNHEGPRENLPMASRIEHTLLKAESTPVDIEGLCKEALKAGLRSVCCLPAHVPRCRSLLEGSDVLIVTVVNFPLAGSLPGVAESECKQAIEKGADEVDFVIPVGALKMGDVEKVFRVASSLVETVGDVPTKAILETGALTQPEIVRGMAAVEAAGVAFAKTSTGFGPGGAKEDDVRLMRLVCGKRLGIKASGGIRDAEFAVRLVEAGADLIGTSSGPGCLG